MKTLFFFISAFLITNLLAEDIPFVVVKQDQCSENNFLRVQLKNIKKELTPPGKKIKPVQDLSYSCFKDSINIDDLVTEMKNLYPTIDTDEIRNNYAKWKKIKNDPKHIDEQTYYKDNPEYFNDKKTEDNQWKWENYFCGRDPFNKNETITGRLDRCKDTNIGDFFTLGCNVGYKCYFPEAPVTIETETIEKECSDVAIFKSDRLDLEDNSKIVKCLDFPSNAKNIKIFFEVCSTVVKREYKDTEEERKTKKRIEELLKVEDDGSNLTLTAARLKELESIIKGIMVARGMQEAMYTLIPTNESEQENYYYDPTAKKLNRTGTCGRRTNIDKYNDDWVTKYKKATENYLESIYQGSSENPKNNPHYTWIYEPTNVDQTTSPDSKMSPGRFNKISVTYEIEKQIPTPQKITFGPPEVHCVGVKAETNDPKPNRNVSNRNKNKIHTRSLTIIPKGKDTPCSR